MKKLIYILTVIALPLCSVSQTNVEFEKKSFPDKKDELKEAIKEIREGDAIWDMNMPNVYPVAIPHYLKAQNFNPNNALLNFRIGVAYLQTHEKGKAYEYITKAYTLKPDVDKKIRYYTGFVYHLRSEWTKAISEYQAYALTVGKDKEEAAKVAKRIEECNTGIELSKNPVRVFIDNVGPEINSSYSDYSPVITADQSIMMFTSRRPGGVSAGLSEEDNLPYEDIWMSTKNGKKWTQARNIGTPVNLELHNAAICLSPDGSKLITYDGAKQGGDLFISELMGAMWTKPEPLGKKINTEGHEASASFSYDAKILYFVSSDRKDGLGGHDIYYSPINEKGKFEHAVNIGPPINTAYDEDGVYMMPDGKTMYFSSKGPGSIGGYDIFKTTYENGHWTQPVNVGIPINTPDDDVFFVLAANGRHAYYASASGKGYGGQDIYRLTILGPEKQPLLNTEEGKYPGLHILFRWRWRSRHDDR